MQPDVKAPLLQAKKCHICLYIVYVDPCFRAACCSYMYNTDSIILSTIHRPRLVTAVVQRNGANKATVSCKTVDNKYAKSRDVADVL